MILQIYSHAYICKITPIACIYACVEFINGCGYLYKSPLFFHTYHTIACFYKISHICLLIEGPIFARARNLNSALSYAGQLPPHQQTRKMPQGKGRGANPKAAAADGPAAPADAVAKAIARVNAGGAPAAVAAAAPVRAKDDSPAKVFCFSPSPSWS